VARIDTEALVLDHQPYRDRHLLLSLLAAETGLVRGILRGARGGKTPRTAAVQILSLVHATGVASRRAELATFHSLEPLRSSYPLATNLERSVAAAVVSELLITFCPEGDPAPRRFRLGVSLLDGLLNGVDPGVGIAYTQFWMLALAGVLPAVEDIPVDAAGRSFLQECRCRPVAAVGSPVPTETARWLDQRSREEAHRQLKALDFFRAVR
jgi:DNA repair protein RecO